VNDDHDSWDFYPCRVDDRPASISLNLRWAREDVPAALDTLYWLRIGMLDPADHGMGTAAEAERLHPVEDAITDGAAKLGLVYVGRLRNDDTWQLVFYGPPRHEEGLEALTGAAQLDGRAFETGSKSDPEWSYFQEFLMPDAERHQWMQDRAVVAALEERGDVVSIPRRVAHWADFPTAAARQAFVEDAAHAGFALESSSDREQSFSAQVFRTDTVELGEIHDVVMALIELAEGHGGEYDGWETSVEKPS